MNFLNKSHVTLFSEKIFLTSFVLLVAIILLSGCDNKKNKVTENLNIPEVDISIVLLQSIQQWDQFNGHISAIESVKIRSRVSGYIQKISFKEGDDIRKGDLLFLIDQRPYRTTLNSAIARKEKVSASYKLAQSQNERAQTLLLNNATSKEEAELRQSSLEQSRAEIKDAEASVEMAKLNLGFTEVRAPISGRISNAIFTIGNLVVADQTILTTIVSQDPVYIYFDPDENSYLRFISGNQTNNKKRGNAIVRVELANEEGFQHFGTVDFLDNQINPTTGTIRARAKLNNESRVFTPGMFARVQLASAKESQKILLDNKAILTDQDHKYVYVIDSENRAQRKNVTIGQIFNGLRIIEKGLDSGDKVVVSGLQKIYSPGIKVKVNILSKNMSSSAI
jgi:membrane fusion protein, multidrug efflux system